MHEIDLHMRGHESEWLLGGLQELLADCRPGRLAVEIGSYAGESLVLLQASGLFERIIAVDPFLDGYDTSDTFSMAYPMQEVRKRLYRRILNLPNVLHLNLTSAEAATLFEDNSIDFLYIDGDHRYEAVSQDIRGFLPKMRNLSIMAGHDYYPPQFQNFSGVRRAVNGLLGGPDLLYQDSSWLKYIGYRPNRNPVHI